MCGELLPPALARAAPRTVCPMLLTGALETMMAPRFTQKETDILGQRRDLICPRSSGGKLSESKG